MYRIPWVPQLLSLISQTVSFGISSDVVNPDVPALDAVSYLIPYMCGIVSRGTRFFFRAHFRRTFEIGRTDTPSEVVWLCFGLGVMLLGMDYTRPPLFQCLELEQWVTVTLRVHVLCGYLSVIVNICCHRLSHCGLDWGCTLLEWIGLHICVWLWHWEFTCLLSFVKWVTQWVNCRRCRSCQSVNNIPKVHNPISLLHLFSIFKTCFRWYPSSISPFFLFSSSFAFLAISCFLSSSTYLSHTLRTGELKQWQLLQMLRLCGPLH